MASGSFSGLKAKSLCYLAQSSKPDLLGVGFKLFKLRFFVHIAPLSQALAFCFYSLAGAGLRQEIVHPCKKGFGFIQLQLGHSFSAMDSV
jgi:hypothetical protein